MGHLLEIKIKRRFRYTNVKIKIILNDRFEKNWNDRIYSVVINTTNNDKIIIRWFEKDVTLTEIQQRFKWKV